MSPVQLRSPLRAGSFVLLTLLATAFQLAVRAADKPTQSSLVPGEEHSLFVSNPAVVLTVQRTL